KYERENPNEYQIQVAQRLCTARHKLEQSKRELIELKQQVFYYKLPSELKDIGASPLLLADSTTAYSTVHHKLLLEDKHEKIYQREKLDSLVPHVIRAEIRYHQADDKFNIEYTAMLNNHRNLVRNKGMTTALSSLLEQRLSNITDRLRDIHYYRINFLLRSSYGDLENMYKQTEPKHQVNSNTFLSNVISDTIHGLNMKQIQLLSRGPCYVPPCQSRLLSSSSNLTSTSVVDIVKKHNAPFNNLILQRTADNWNTFYIGNRKEFDTKANKHMAKSDDIYEFIVSISDGSKGMDDDDDDLLQQQPPPPPQDSQYLLSGRIEAINFALEILEKRKALNHDTISKLRIDPSKVKLPHLYFLPDISKVSIDFNRVLLTLSFVGFVWTE
ncbi:unnamed protein product, partial [Adineta ricciae]